VREASRFASSSQGVLRFVAFQRCSEEASLTTPSQ
jgi:hypothetical protein